MLPCPACSLETPDLLLCRHDSPVCPSCCAKEHDTKCPDCKGRGAINVTRAARARHGAYLPAGTVGPNGYDLIVTCATCDGTKHIPKENQ